LELVSHGERIAHAMASDRPKGSTSEVGHLDLEGGIVGEGSAEDLGGVSKVEKKI
jgi:hypothetical protein